MSLSSCMYQKCPCHLMENSFLSRANIHCFLVALSLTPLTPLPQAFLDFAIFFSFFGFLISSFLFLPRSIISQCMHILKHHIICLKYIQCLSIIKLEEKKHNRCLQSVNPLGCIRESETHKGDFPQGFP